MDTHLKQSIIWMPHIKPLADNRFRGSAALRLLLGQSLKTINALRFSFRQQGSDLSFDVSPDNTKLAIVNVIPSDDGQSVVDILNLDTEEILYSFREDESCHTAKFSPDSSQLLLTCGNLVKVLFLSSDRQPISFNNDNTINSAEFSSDGLSIVTASSDGMAKVIRLDTEAVRTFAHPGVDLKSAKFSNDGQKIITVGDTGAWVWDIKSEKNGQNPVPFSHTSFIVNSATFSPDGNFVVTAGWDRKAKIWNLKDEAERWKKQEYPHPVELMHGDENVTSAMFSPDGERILTASNDGSAKVWGAATGTLFLTLSHGDSVNSAEYSWDQSKIITASNDRTAKIWDAKTGQLILSLEDTDKIEAAKFSHDGKFAFTQSGIALRAWKIAENDKVQKHKNAITAAEFSPDGNRVLSASADSSSVEDEKSGRIWNPKDGEIAFFLKNAGAINSAVYSHDGRKIVTAVSSCAKVWDSKSGDDPLFQLSHDPKILEINGYESSQPVKVTRAEFSPDDKRLATGDENGVVKIWNAGDGGYLFSKKFNGYIMSLNFSEDNRRLLIVSVPDVYILDMENESVVPVENAPADHSYKWVANYAEFSPDGERIVIANDNNIAAVSGRNGKTLFFLNHRGLETDDITKAKFSPDGKKIITASLDGTAKIWSREDGELLLSLQHRGPVNSAEFSFDGQLVVTASSDNTAKVWNAETGKLLLLLKHSGAVKLARFSKDGTRLVTGAGEAAGIWDLSSGLPEKKEINNWLEQKNFFHMGNAFIPIN